MKKLLIQMIVVLALLTLVACSSSADAGEDLVGPVWVATSLNGHNLVSIVTLSAEFTAEDSVSGSTGCNNYTTSYTVDGNSITFGEEMAMTRALCADPINEQEREYVLALAEADSFEINDDELTLQDSDDNTLVVYMAQSQALEGSSWQVMSYANLPNAVTTLINGTEMTAIFGEDGQLTGSSGCNTYTATYESEDDTISIGPPAATRQFCAEPEGVMEQESAYLAALETAVTYRIEGNFMNMRTADGATVADFSRTTGQ